MNKCNPLSACFKFFVLLWVLGIQTGANVVIMVLGALLVISIAGWIFGRWGNLAMPKRTRLISMTLAAIITVSTLFLTITSVDSFAMESDSATENQQGKINWQPYSEELVQEIHKAEQPLFIDFTAAWCLSCQVNDRITFGSEEVQDKFAELDIKAVKAMVPEL